MEYKLMPCTEDDAKWIEEQAENVFNAIAPPEPGAEEKEMPWYATSWNCLVPPDMGAVAGHD